MAEIDLPDTVKALRPLLEEFQRFNKLSQRQETEWYRRCLDSPALERWRANKLIKKETIELKFPVAAARAYSALFEILPENIPHCFPSRVIEVSSAARNLMDLLPDRSILPGDAQNPSFIGGLNSLSRWMPSDLQEGVSAKGNALRRWMTRKIVEEIYRWLGVFPPCGVVCDLIEFGWPGTPEKSIRRMMTDKFLHEVKQAANTKFEYETNSMTIAHQAMTKASINAYRETREVEAVLEKADPPSSDKAIIDKMEQLSLELLNEDLRQRAMSFMRVLHDAASYPQEGEDQGQ
ncbi:hypothetical protein [Methylomagnum sp.]